jgi:hypothetical protein
MQTIIESFSDLKTTERGPSAKIKVSNGDQIYINEDPTNLVGKTVDIDVNDKTSQKGNRYKVGTIIKVHEASAATASSNGNGKITWDAYRAMAEAAHSLAGKLEPDVPDGNLDRSSARAAILNTVMIAYSNGKIVLSEDDDNFPWERP